MYNLLSDKLDRFEREMRKIRNMCAGKTMSWLFRLTHWFLKKCRPYIHTDYLKQFRERIVEVSIDVEQEFELRKRIQASNSEVD